MWNVEKGEDLLPRSQQPLQHPIVVAKRLPVEGGTPAKIFSRFATFGKLWAQIIFFR